MSQSRPLLSTNDPAFKRDTVSGALLNSDLKAAESYFEQRRRYIELQRVKEDVQSMKAQMDDIKSLLLQLVNGNK